MTEDAATPEDSRSASGPDAPAPPEGTKPEASSAGGTADDAPPAEPSAPAPEATPAPAAVPPPPYKPNYVFLAVVSIVSLVADLGTKAWAKVRLDDAQSFIDRRIEVVHDHLWFTFARNRGGAWGLFQDQPESVRRPFFLAISVLAITFIVSLYRKLTPRQWALKWGLPLVLGGALGNLVNRIQYNFVVDFIDVRADLFRSVNGLFSKHPSDHWPTFNIADVAIVAGVILMAIDMFTPAPVVRKGGIAPGAAPAADAKPDDVVASPEPPAEPPGEPTAPKPEAPAET